MEIIKTDLKFKNKLITRKETKYIILHCTATKEGKNYTVEDIHKWHLNNGWSGIGYHYVIYLDGTIHQGRNFDSVGAHCTARNNDSIGICLIGGLSKDGKTAKDTRNDLQKQSLYKLVEYLLDEYNLSINDVYCHNQFANKACPSFKIDQFKKEYNIYKEEKYKNELIEKNKSVKIL